MLLLNHVRIIDLNITPIDNPEPMTLYYGSRGASDVLEVYVCFQDGILRKLGGGGGALPIIELYGVPILDSSGTVHDYYPDMIVPEPYADQSNGIDFMMKQGQVITMSGVVTAAGCRNEDPSYIYTSWKVDLSIACSIEGKIVVLNKEISPSSSPREGVDGHYWDLDILTQDSYEPTLEEEQNGFQPLASQFCFSLTNGVGNYDGYHANLELSGKLMFTSSNARQFLLE